MRVRSTTPMIAVLLALLLAVITTLVVSDRYFQGELLRVHGRAQTLVRDIERIRYFDEVLTSTARLGALTGAAEYRQRYLATAPKLDEVLAEALRVADDRTASMAIEETSDANRALIELETRSFDLSAEGRPRRAYELLTSARYRQLKQVYAGGFHRAAAAILEDVRASETRVQRFRGIALAIGLIGAAVLLIAGVLLLRLTRERERLLSGQARRRTEELDYLESQRTFSEILQVTRHEAEAHDLVKRHIEHTVDGTAVAILSVNNSNDRLELRTESDPGSGLHLDMEGAIPDACSAIRLGRPHARGESEARLLLRCEICGDLPGASVCTPSLVGGEVIGSVLVGSREPLDADGRRRVRETVAQAAPVLANLRNLALAENRAMTDALTGLANKRSMEDTLNHMVALAGRRKSPLAAIMLDLDHFKQVNDIFGHESGDAVLASVGAAIADALRDSDFAGRYGGEEFLLLLPDTDRTGALEVAQRLHAAIGALLIPGDEHRVTASLGVAVLPHDAGNAVQLLRSADRALYAAKQAGRNRIHAVWDMADAADARSDELS